MMPFNLHLSVFMSYFSTVDSIGAKRLVKSSWNFHFYSITRDAFIFHQSNDDIKENNLNFRRDKFFLYSYSSNNIPRFSSFSDNTELWVFGIICNKKYQISNIGSQTIWTSKLIIWKIKMLLLMLKGITKRLIVTTVSFFETSFVPFKLKGKSC